MTATRERPKPSPEIQLRADLEATNVRLENLESRLEPARPTLRPLAVADRDALERASAAHAIARRRSTHRLTYRDQCARAVRLLRTELWLHWLRVRYLGLEAAMAWLCAQHKVDAVRTADGLVFVLRLEGGAA